MIDILKIKEQVDGYVASERKIFPQHTNRASEMGHPCLRRLVYCRTNWQDRLLPSIELQYRFNEGKIQEKAVLRLLEDSGIQIIEQQTPYNWKDFTLTGSIDGKILIEGKAYPVEIKSFAPYLWASINDVDDMFTHKYVFVRKYPSQLLLYMLMGNVDTGLFILKNKATGQIKYIELLLNSYIEVAESAIKKCELVNKHIIAKTLPNQINDTNICQDCDFFHICLPNIVRDELQLISDPDIALKLTRRDELKTSVSEYDQLDKELKSQFKDKGSFSIGDYLINNIKRHRDGYTVNPVDYTEVRIKNIKAGGNNGD